MLIFKLAVRNVFRNMRRTILTCTLISFGLVALILTDAIVEGMSKLMIESVTKTLQGDMQVHHPDYLDTRDQDDYISHVSQMSKTIESDPLVSGFAVRTISGGMVSSSYNMSSALIYGIDPVQELNVSRISDAVVEGNYLGDIADPGSSVNEILVGSEMASLLEVSLGDRLIVTVSEIDTGELSQSLFRLSGIVHFGVREMDSSFVFMRLDKARSLLKLEDQSHEIAIRFHDQETSHNLDLALRKSLSSDDSEALNWLEFNPEIGSIIETSAYSTMIVGGILFLLVSLGVINSMFMSIYERIYEFGVAKAIGTSSAQILRLVLCEALVLAIISCVFGLILGALLSYWTSHTGIPIGEGEVSGVAFQNNIVPVNKAYQFVNFPIYVVLLTMVAALYPASYAAKIVPATALHKSL